jgi:tetrahydromethanopterin S-methyltransferase subunit C
MVAAQARERARRAVWRAATSPEAGLPEWAKTLIIIVIAAVIGAVIGILIRKLVLKR